MNMNMNMNMNMQERNFVYFRSTIARHLLSDQSDPFNRNPLTMDQVIKKYINPGNINIIQSEPVNIIQSEPVNIGLKVEEDEPKSSKMFNWPFQPS